MAGSRTQARGFQLLPLVNEKCYPVRLSAALVPRRSLPMSSVSDPSVIKCDTGDKRADSRAPVTSPGYVEYVNVALLQPGQANEN